MNALRSRIREAEGFFAAFAVQLLVGYDLRPLCEELRSMLDDVPCTFCGSTDHVSLREEVALHG